MAQSNRFTFRLSRSVNKQELTSQRRQGWYPPGLRWWSLAIAVLCCWTFITLLQYYLHQSQTQGGILFAAKVNDLPLHRSFWHLYLPTIIAVIFSIFIVWIDHDAKRYEPYRQLSRSDGALPKNSILLHYPFDFAPIVPLVAAKRKHWLVFWASFASVLTSFGVVPLQAGIFSTRSMVRNFPQDYAVSDGYIHSSIQEQALTLSYAQSAFGILKLNETLPAFTTRNYTLKPFTASGRAPVPEDSWTVNTVLYSMNLRCEKAEIAGKKNGTVIEQKTVLYAVPGDNDPPQYEEKIENVTHTITSDAGFNSSTGCYISRATFNNNTSGEQVMVNSKPVSQRYRKFSASYEGYFSPSLVTGSASGNLRDRSFCGVLGNQTFFATFTQNKKDKLDPASGITALFCKPFYYEQDVEATVDAMTGEPRNVSSIGTKRLISADLFNSTVFEDTLASGERQIQTREEALPMITIPRHLEDLYDTELSPSVFAAPPILTTVMSQSKDYFQELLDPEKLGEAYELVYQVFFARAMTDILRPNFSIATTITGQRQTRTEAVVLEPFFAYFVEGLLAIVSLAIIALMYIGYTERQNSRLADDPASLAAIMSMVADDKDLLARFEDLDCAPAQYFHQKLCASGYKLGNDVSDYSMTPVNSSSESQQPLLKATHKEKKEEQTLSNPIRPTEFQAATAIPFTSLFVVLMILLAVLFAISRSNGLPLPSRDPVVQNLVTEYLPTAIATLIEPMWIMINRLLCVLQPLEQLRGLGAAAQQSITLRYGSLPPQLTLIKAARSSHFLLATVCGMSLLANLLATAFAGLFFRTTLSLPYSTSLLPPFEPKFVNVNGTSGPPITTSPYYDNPIEASGAYRKSMGETHFLLSESNLTRNTSLPSWTDENAMYLPFRTSEHNMTLTTDLEYQARTRYFTAEPRCRPLSFGKDYHMHLWPFAKEDSLNSFNVTVLSSNGTQTTCYGADKNEFINGYGLFSKWRMEATGGMSCRNGKTAAEMTTTLKSHPNATEYEQEICRSAVVVGWMRATQRYCDRTPPADFEAPSFGGFEDATSKNNFFMLCQPEIRIGEATVLVGSDGVLKERARDFTVDNDQSPQALDQYFSNGATNIISQSNLFIFRTLKPWWHNDTFASEFMHYFVNRADGSTRLTDPNEPLPTFEDVEDSMNKAYARLFAIWLGVNKELLFLPATNTTAEIPGSIIKREERLFFVMPLFVIAQVILCVYIIVSIIVFFYRPGRYLPRMPTSIAAVIALFSSSAALKDLQGTSSLTNKEREKYLKDLGCEYGYGSYVGSDGGVHVGIEKAPFVTYMDKFSFAGSRADQETIRRRNVQSSSASRIKTTVEYTNIPLEDLEQRRTDVFSHPGSGLQPVYYQN